MDPSHTAHQALYAACLAIEHAQAMTGIPMRAVPTMTLLTGSDTDGWVAPRPGQDPARLFEDAALLAAADAVVVVTECDVEWTCGSTGGAMSALAVTADMARRVYRPYERDEEGGLLWGPVGDDAQPPPRLTPALQKALGVPGSLSIPDIAVTLNCLCDDSCPCGSLKLKHQCCASG